MTNEGLSINVLKFYYNATPMVIRVLNFTDYLAKLKAKNPSFMEYFAKAVTGLNIGKVQAAMEELGRKSTALEYMPSPYFEALATTGTANNFGDYAAAAGDGVLAAGAKLFDLGSSSLMLYAAIAAIGVFVLPKLLAELPKYLKTVK